MEKSEITTNTIAQLYIKQGYLDKAIDIYRAIVELDPSNDAARMKIEELRQKMKEKEAEFTTGDVAKEIKREEGSTESQIRRLEGWLENVRAYRRGGI